jgi:hypothetical protein
MNQTTILENETCECEVQEPLRSELNTLETSRHWVREWHAYRLRIGMAPESNEGVSRSGIYTDFT